MEIAPSESTVFCVRNYGVEIGITGRKVIGLTFEEGLRLAAAERDYPPPPSGLDWFGFISPRRRLPSTSRRPGTGTTKYPIQRKP